MNYFSWVIAMLKSKTILFWGGLILCMYQGSVLAATATCVYSNTNEINQPYAIPPANITLNNNISDYTVLYNFSFVMLGIVTSGCTGSAPVQRGVTISALPNGKTPISWGGYTIYPTSVPGLGISIRNRDTSNLNIDVPLYPSVLVIGGGTGNGGWVDMRLWKIPGDLPTSSGIISFTGPTYNQVYHLTNAADSFTATNMTLSPAGSVRDWSMASRTLTGSATLTSGSCDLISGNKIVQLGTYMHNAQTDHSAWKDASFTLKCPNANGYGGTVTNTNASGSQYNANTGVLTANTVKNANLTIKIVPRTPIVIADHLGKPLDGTIELDGTGAKGYGVQLAWGDYSMQSAGVPAKPVIFNTPVAASQLNSAFTSGPYAIGAAMPLSEIKMSARFTRIGDVQVGPAKASVEVVANYN